MRADTTHIDKIKQDMLVKNICINEYRQTHSCKKQDQCNFRHEIEEHERASPNIRKAMKERWEKITNTKRKMDSPSFEDQLKEATNVVNNLQKILESVQNRP